MKLFLISTGILISSFATAQNSTSAPQDQKSPEVETDSKLSPAVTPKTEELPSSTPDDQEKQEIPPESQAPSDTKKPNSKSSEGNSTEVKKPSQEAGAQGKEAISEEPTHSPYGASYSFGLTRINEGSLNLNSSGFARIEVHRKMTQRLLNFERLEIGLNYSGADIGGNMGKTGAYTGAVNFYGGRFSAFTKPKGKWFYQYTGGFDLAKIKKVPAFSFISAKTTVSYAPVLSVGGAAHYYLMKGLTIGPRLDLALGGVTGWNFGFQARLAY